MQGFDLNNDEYLKLSELGATVKDVNDFKEYFIDHKFANYNSRAQLYEVFENIKFVINRISTKDLKILFLDLAYYDITEIRKSRASFYGIHNVYELDYEFWNILNIKWNELKTDLLGKDIAPLVLTEISIKQRLLVLDYENKIPNRVFNKTQTAKYINKEYGYSEQTIRTFLTAWGKNSENNPITKNNLEYVKNYFEINNNPELAEKVKKDLEQLIDNQLNKSNKRK